MPDPIVAQDAVAASSPAADPTPAVSPETGGALDLDTLNETDLHQWRLDGKTPDASKAAATTAGTPPATPVHEPAASTDATLPAASEPATPAKAKGADARIPELLADRAKERARAERAERHIRDLEARPRPPARDDRPAASSAAPTDPALVRPDPAAYDYGTADPAYLEALTDYKVAVTLDKERTAIAAEHQERRAREEFQRVRSAFDENTAAARTAHPDFDAVALDAETFIPPGSLTDLFILENKPDALGAGGAEVLYHLQQPANLAEQKRILRLPTMDQIIALVRLGDRLKAGAPASTQTQAPPPPPTLTTRATPADPVERAIRDDDTAAYNTEMNRRDLARRHSKR